MARTPTAIALLLLSLACRDRGADRGAGQGRDGEAAALVPARLELGAWVRWGPSDLGCWMERALAYRDARWSCSTPGTRPAEDPCEDGWRAGPEVPDAVARRIHPRLRRVALAWERGALQAATFQFDPDVPPQAMPRILGLEPGSLEGAAWHGAGRCDTPCYQVVVFAPAPADCVDEAEADEDDPGADE